MLVDLSVEVQQRNYDPFYSLYAADKIELAVLVITLRSTTSGAELWRGEIRDQLRIVSRTMGGLDPAFVATEEPRVWHAREMARAIVRRLD